jgi:hypothetical protein
VVAGIVCGATEDPKKGPLYTVGIFITSAAIGAIASLFIKEELRRLRPKVTSE